MGVVTEAGNQVGNHCCYLLVYRLAAPCVCAGHTMQVRLAPGAYTDAFGRQPAGLQGSVLTLAKQTAQVLLMAGDLCQSSLDRLCAGARRERARVSSAVATTRLSYALWAAPAQTSIDSVRSKVYRWQCGSCLLSEWCSPSIRTARTGIPYRLAALRRALRITPR
jgi:hypothetical protein